MKAAIIEGDKIKIEECSRPTLKAKGAIIKIRDSCHRSFIKISVFIIKKANEKTAAYGWRLIIKRKTPNTLYNKDRNSLLRDLKTILWFEKASVRIPKITIPITKI